MTQIGIDSNFDFLFDRQQDSPVWFCPECGKEIYTAGNEFCFWCMEDMA